MPNAKRDVYLGQVYEIGCTVPHEIQLFPKGTWKIPGSQKAFNYGDPFFNELLSNFKEVPLDYEHASEIIGQKAPAAGWIAALVKKTDGLWAVIKNWTDEAMQHITQGEYKYISPAWAFTATDPRTGDKIGAQLSSVALTNRPYFQGMQPLCAHAGVDPGVCPPVNFHQLEKEKEEGMKEFATALGLKEDSPKEEVLTVLGTRLKELADLKSASEKILATAAPLKLDKSAPGGGDEKVIALEAKVLALEEKTLAGEKAQTEMATAHRREKSETLVDGAVKEGRVYPFERDKLVVLASQNYEDVQKLLAQRPVVVPVGERVAKANVATDQKVDRSLRGKNVDPVVLARHQRALKIEEDKKIPYAQALEMAVGAEG